MVAAGDREMADQGPVHTSHQQLCLDHGAVHMLDSHVDPWVDPFVDGWADQAGSMLAPAPLGSAGPLQQEHEPGSSQGAAAATAAAKASRRGLTPAQLRASRSYRARRKSAVNAMQDEIREKQQLVAQLEAEQQQLASKAHALQIIAGGSKSAQELLMQQMHSMAVSDNCGPSSMAQQAAEASTSTGCSTSVSGVSSLDTVGSLSSSDTRSPSTQSSTEQQIDPDILEMVQHYRHFMHQARGLVQDIDEGTAGPGTLEQVKQVVHTVNDAFTRLALKDRTKVFAMQAFNLDTLAPCEQPPEEHWRGVLAACKLPDASVQGLLACYDVYEGRRLEIMQERAQIGEALAHALAAATDASDVDASDGGAAGGSSDQNSDGRRSMEAGTAAYEELVAEMHRSLNKEHVLEHTFQSSSYVFLEPLDVARMCVLSYPFQLDIHKLLAVMRQP